MTKDNDEKLLDFLTLQNARLSSHVDKIWEEMKHFSAVLYVLLGAPFFLDKDLKSIWLIIFPSLAIFVAFTAICIICKESKDFLDVLGTVLSIEKRLEFHKEYADKIPAKIVSEDRKERLGINESIDDFIKKESCKRYSTRWWFKSYFKVLIIFGFIEIDIIIIKYWLNLTLSH